MYGADNATPLDRLAVLAMITVGLWIGWAAVNFYWWGDDSKREMRERLRVLLLFITLE